jgi:hypothetical protein
MASFRHHAGPDCAADTEAYQTLVALRDPWCEAEQALLRCRRRHREIAEIEGLGADMFGAVGPSARVTRPVR